MADDDLELLPTRTWDQLIATSKRRGTYLRRRRRVLAAAPAVLVALAVSAAVPLALSGSDDPDVLDVATEPSPSGSARALPEQARSPEPDPNSGPEAAAPGHAAPAPAPVAAPQPDDVLGPRDAGPVPAPRTSPVPAADGVRRLVFARGTQYEPNQRNFELVTAREDGTDEKQLTTSLTDDEYDPAWSPDGTSVAFAKDQWSGRYGDQAVGGIFVMNADGSAARRLTRIQCTTVGPCFDEEPAWSPDGGAIAFHRGSNTRECEAASSCPSIWTVQPDGSDLHRVTTGWDVDWSPDGRHLVFADASTPGAHSTCVTEADVPDRCQSYLYISNADGTDRRPLGVAGTAPRWSPDGTRIVFEAEGEYRYDIAVLEVATGEVTRLTRDANWEYSPAWSPDGRDVVFVSGGDVHVIGSDGQNRRQVTRTPETEETPRFAPA